VNAEVRIGTRGSALALAQARITESALARAGVQTRLVVIETAGDRRAVDAAWGEGAFVAAIERALLDDRVDLAVHSAKDVPTAEDDRLVIGAYLPRADPRDALVVRPGLGDAIDELPSGARIGTDSPRRTGFLLATRPDLDVRPLHGNVDTRLRRLDEGEADALVLACAGLDRLGLGARISQRIDPQVVPPAPGQGAIAIQVRADDARMRSIVARNDDRATRLAVGTERAFLAAAGGGCRSPIGAVATIADGSLDLLGGYVGVDGSEVRFGRLRGDLEHGLRLAEDLVATLGGAPTGPSAGRDRSPLAGGPRVLITRPAEHSGDLVEALRSAGLDPLVVPTFEIDQASDTGPLARAINWLGTYAWVVVTSANGARAVIDGMQHAPRTADRTRWAAIGGPTRQALEGDRIPVEFQPSRGSSAAMAAELPVEPGDRVLLVRGNLAGTDLPAALRARGAIVDDVVGYRTVEAPSGSGALLRQAFERGRPAAILFTSGSTVRGLVELAHRESLEVLDIPAVCIGPGTAAVAEGMGFRVTAVAAAADAPSMARAMADAVRDHRAPAGATTTIEAGATRR
jgi:hydroxymethylbilane synthase